MVRKQKKAKRMSLLSFLSSSTRVAVLDASVVINLNATAVAAEIFGAFPNVFAITENAFDELKRGISKGYDDAAFVQRHVDAGTLKLVSIPTVQLDTYEDLVSGTASSTLDDGEAATIACSIGLGAVAAIDERKALTICSQRFPKLPVFSTAELLLSDIVGKTLGPEAHQIALMNALQKARMRVPFDLAPAIITIIGSENASQCSSLPKGLRQPSE